MIYDGSGFQHAKERGWSKKTEEQKPQKSQDSSLAVGSYLKRGSATPPPPNPEPVIHHVELFQFSINFM